MDIHEKIAQTHDEMTKWRRTLHETPETAFEEVQTSQFVADKLESFGIKVERGLAGTGVIGIVEGKNPGSPGRVPP